MSTWSIRWFGGSINESNTLSEEGCCNRNERDCSNLYYAEPFGEFSMVVDGLFPVRGGICSLEFSSFTVDMD